MNKTLLSAAIITLLIPLKAPADTIRIGTEGAYAPWNYFDDSGKLAGFEIDLGNYLCERAALTCEFVSNEWDSIIPNLIAGNYDAIMAGMAVTEERKQTIRFSAEYFPPDSSVFAAASGDTFDFDNLAQVRIGVQGATIQAEYVEKHYAQQNTVLSYETPDQSIADLSAGNIDLLLAHPNFLVPVIANSSGKLTITGPKVALGGGVAVGLRKEDTGLAEKLNGAIAAAKADGTLDKLIKDYFDSGPHYQ